MKTIKVFGKNIYFKPIKVDSILQSDAVAQRGEVIDIGEDVKFVKKGDIIIFAEWGIKWNEVEGEKLAFIKEVDDVLLAKENVRKK